MRYPIRLGRRSRPLLRLFGVRGPDDAWVELDGPELRARFGFARVRTPLVNIARWRIEGPWRWITAIGIRRSIRGGDLSFAGSPHGGVRLDFREPVRYGPLRPRVLYVAVDDLEGLAAALAERGIPGEDGRAARAR
ncbi:MAG TPA: hypothetical protein VFK54_00515 [Candidatus Limnocylindrales bacterium]|nr:hypothetical protein [Candidatus Limnocylindrales bacterium]